MDADEGGGGRIHRGEFFEHHCRIEPAHAQAADAFIGVKTAKAEFGGLGDGLAREVTFCVPLRCVRGELLVGEVAGGGAEGFLLVVQIGCIGMELDGCIHGDRVT